MLHDEPPIFNLPVMGVDQLELLPDLTSDRRVRDNCLWGRGTYIKMKQQRGNHLVNLQVGDMLAHTRPVTGAKLSKHG